MPKYGPRKKIKRSQIKSIKAKQAATRMVWKVQCSPFPVSANSMFRENIARNCDDDNLTRKSSSDLTYKDTSSNAARSWDQTKLNIFYHATPSPNYPNYAERHD